MSPRGRPAPGGGRWVEVAPERIAGWLDRFAVRHGGVTGEPTGYGWFLRGDDGGTAECRLPLGWPGEAPGDDPDAFVAAASHRWPVGILLVRRGAHAVGTALGEELLTSKVDTRYVQGRTAAGGWSQQRFARRRANQTRESVAAAAEHAARVLSAAAHPPAGLVVGGDRAMVDAVLADPCTAPWSQLPRAPFLDVPEPRHATLVTAATRYRAIRILLRAAGGAG